MPQARPQKGITALIKKRYRLHEQLQKDHFNFCWQRAPEVSGNGKTRRACSPLDTLLRGPGVQCRWNRLVTTG